MRLKDDPQIRFLFVGGGLGKKEVEAFIRDYSLGNVISLPYQPLERLGESLSAADVHVVSLGPEMVGIIHPCKIYGAMTVARPILYFGPTPSHAADLINAHHFGLSVAHGDVDAAVSAIHRLCEMSPDQRQQMGDTAQTVLRNTLSQKLLCAKVCDALEKTFWGN